MANYKVVYTFTFTDVDGHVATTAISGGPSGDTNMISDLATNSSGLVASISALTNAKLTRRGISIELDSAQGVGTDAEYPVVEQKASLVYLNNKGSKSVLHIPAPKLAMFKAAPERDIVDSSASIVTTFNTAVEGVLRDQGATALNLFGGGSLSSRRRSRKVAIRN